ncbi:MAG: hypothetical protein P8Q92_11650 [Pseudoprimorskyibacter sp.]|nr:hypothetical protein [Pseudoprimorskyibacter sp.]
MPVVRFSDPRPVWVRLCVMFVAAASVSGCMQPSEDHICNPSDPDATNCSIAVLQVDEAPVEKETFGQSPDGVGLVVVRSYPNANSACSVIGESAATLDLLDHTYLLVGCPIDNLEANQALKTSGGHELKRIGQWMLFAVPH